MLATTVRAAPPPPPSFLTYDQVEPVLRACQTTAPADRSGWPRWIEDRDREIRSRLVRGQEDSLVNFVLFGVSFTRLPRVALENPDAGLIDARIQDFVRAMASPGGNERLAWLKELVESRGLLEPERLARYVSANISRYRQEQRQYSRVLDKGPANDPVAAQLYRERGLSLDTSFRPNYAVEETLAELKRRGTLATVRRAAVIGPGLDFTDKDGGFDYYPLQTLQPFALIDSLLRLGMARLPDLRVAVFEISPQVLDHLSQPRRPYTIQLVLDQRRQWDRGARAYWRRFGDSVGARAPPLAAPPQIRNVSRRAIRIRPEVWAAIDPEPLNVVSQHFSENYDLIVATNVLVYYDGLEQLLSLVNIQSMLASGGIFLSNSPLPQCSVESLHSIGRREVRYSTGAGDDDRVEIHSNTVLRRGLGPE